MDSPTVEERIDLLLPRLKREFKKRNGNAIFNYIYIDGDMQTDSSRFSDDEFIEFFFKEFSDVNGEWFTGEGEYECSQCISINPLFPSNLVSMDYILNRHPYITSEDEFKIMNYCDSCQDDYLNSKSFRSSF
ncbi:MAG: hypothetical protein ACLFNB_01280 [Candidatus Woesearchaeota archaeon]